MLCLLVWTWAIPVFAAEPPITALTFSPDGQDVVIGSQAGITVCEWPSLRKVKQLPSDQAGIHAVAFAPGGKRLAVAGGVPSEQGTVEIYSWPELDLEMTLRGHDDTIQTIEWRDDEVFVTGSLDHEIAIWSLLESKPLRRLAGHSKGVTTVEFLADGKQLLSGSIDQNVRLWDVESGQLLRTLNNHTRPIHASRRRPQREGLPMVATASDDRTVRFWQPTIGRMVRFCRLDQIPLALTWLGDGTLLLVACSDGAVRCIDPETAEVKRVIPVLKDWAYVIEVDPSGSGVVVGGREGQLQQLSLDE
ncbi:MAG: WD40 repeat domain-containing protein [Rubripirellula sp.]